MTEVGRTAPELPREHKATFELAKRSVPAPESVGRQESAPESVGAKRTTPEQGSSDPPVKRARVHSKM
jgi:hypothetical protein